MYLSSRFIALGRFDLRLIPLLCGFMWASLPLLIAQDAYHQWLQSYLQTSYGLPSGQWILPNEEGALFDSSWLYGASGQILSAADSLSFESVLSITVPEAGLHQWYAGFGLHTTGTIAAGDACLLAIWLRADTSGKVSVYAEHATTYEKELYWTLYLDAHWRLYLLPFVAQQGYGIGQLSVGMHLAWQAQHIEMAGLAVLNYGQGLGLSDLPLVSEVAHYGGWDPDAPWRAEAAQRIDSLRKAELQIVVYDLNGTPVPDVAVQVRMLRHHYGFGSAVVASMIANNPEWDSTYEAHLLNLDGQGHGFNEVVFENALKWPAWEENWITTPDQTASAAQWLVDHGMRLRGHNILWPGFSHLPDDIEAHQEDPLYIKTRLFAHLEEIVNYPGIDSSVAEWDVLNEITTNRDLEMAFAGTAGYTTGRELYPEVLMKVVAEAPLVYTYVNDYVTISSGITQGPLYEQYKQFVQEIVDAGAPLHGIGFQAHVDAQLPSLYDVQAILDDFYTIFGLSAKITEFDFDDQVPDGVAGSYMRDFLTMVFSHPATESLLMWGFWDGAHYRNNAPMFRADWSLKPAGTAFIDMVFGQWWTDTVLVTDVAGVAQVRAFKGLHQIQVDCGGELVLIDTIELEKDVSITIMGCPLPTALKSVSPHPDLVLYPNPAMAGQRLYIEGLSPNASLWLRAVNGQKIALTRDGATCLLPRGLSSGLWYVVVYERDKLTYWPLIVQ